MMRTLFLQAPSFEGFDGGAGSRYQAKREIASFWYPTWLAQPAALVEGSKLIDAPPHKIGIEAVVKQARDYDLVVLHTSTPSFESDVRTIEAMKAANRGLKAGMIGAKVAVEADKSLKASRSSTSWRAASSTSPSRTWPRGGTCRRSRGLSWRNERRCDRRTMPSGRSSKTWTCCLSSPRSTSAT